jgi:hypothetical protein
MRKQIFISYSHEDQQWLERLVKALAPYARSGEIEHFDDSGIQPGEDWRHVLDEEMARANVAVLLVSSAFLASDFIARVELPRILERADEDGLTVLWVPVSASAWDRTPLRTRQAAISPEKPLDQMARAKAEEALVKVARVISGGRAMTDIGRAMELIDELYSEVGDESALPSEKPASVQARHTGSTVEFKRRGVSDPIAVITAADLERLPEQEHRLVQTLEANMTNEFERWTMLHPRRKTLTPRELEDYESAGREMCGSLGQILDFIEQGLGKYLQDHYVAIRYSCDRLIGAADN